MMSSNQESTYRQVGFMTGVFLIPLIKLLNNVVCIAHGFPDSLRPGTLGQPIFTNVCLVEEAVGVLSFCFKICATVIFDAEPLCR